jgi:NADH-ubiquinone oxidoreductase chain 2
MFTNSLNHLQKNIHGIYINRITILTLVVSILLTFNTLYFQTIGKGIGCFTGLFQVTIPAQLIEIFLLIIGISILSGWPLLYNKSILNGPLNKISDTKINIASDQYSLIAIFSILGGSLLMSSLDLLSMYLSIELQSFALYILATLNKDKLSSASAGLKYFLLGGLSSCFILLGSGLIYSYTGLTQLESIYTLLSITSNPFFNFDSFDLNSLILNNVSPSLQGYGLDQLNLSTDSNLISVATRLESYKNVTSLLNEKIFIDLSRGFNIGLILIIVGFLFKVSAAPFYQWSPDVYAGTPTIVTVWLTIVAKLTIFIFLLSLLDFSLPPISTGLDQFFYLYNEVISPLFNLALRDNSSITIVPESNNVIEESNTIFNNKFNVIKETLSKIGLLDSLLNNNVNTLNTTLNESSYLIKNLLLICSLLSLIIGTVAGLSQVKIKRLLAFSSISHVGFMLLALGIYSERSIDSLIFYIVQYSITSLNIFLILLAFGYLVAQNKINDLYIISHQIKILYILQQEKIINKISRLFSKDLPSRTGLVNITDTDLNYLSELKGLLNKYTLLSVSFAICLFSMAGIPPLIGFFSKQFVLFSSIENGNVFLSFVAILVSVISASYYLKLIQIVFFSSPSLQDNEQEITTLLKINNNSPSLQYGPHSIDNYNFKTLIKSFPLSQYIENNIKNNIELSSIHSYIISILTLTILFFFMNPSIILNVTQLIALTIFNI